MLHREMWGSELERGREEKERGEKKGAGSKN